MKLVEKREAVLTVSKTGKEKYRPIGLFFCPVCKQAVERDLYNGKRADSCGSKKCQINRSERHGYVGTSIYTAWANMKARCDNPKAKAYKYKV